MVLRDREGKYLGGRARWYDYSRDALTMEAFACRDALKLARELGVTRLSLETDCQEFVHLWASRGTQRSEVAGLLAEITEVNHSFLTFSLNFVSRDSNRVAHELAKQVSSACVTGEWLSEPPVCVERLLLSDCNPAHVE